MVETLCHSEALPDIDALGYRSPTCNNICCTLILYDTIDQSEAAHSMCEPEVSARSSADGVLSERYKEIVCASKVLLKIFLRNHVWPISV